MEVSEKSENDESREFDIKMMDFPFICRICLKRGDLRLFEEEDYLFDLFLVITKIDITNVHSTGNFPRNVCNECINELEDISLFIDISKFNAAARQEKNLITKRENKNVALVKVEDNIYIEKLEMCRICLSTSCLTPIEEKSHLMQLFMHITNIGAEAETNFLKRNSICDKCINELEKIFLFISLSFYNDMKLKKTIGVKYMKFESISGTTDVMVENDFSESKDLHEVVDIKEYIYRLEASDRQNTQNGMEFCSETNFVKNPLECDSSENKFSTENHLKMIPKVLESQFITNEFECDCCKKSFSHRGNLKRHMLAHTRQKPFKCGCCKKSFAHKYELKSHLPIHTRERAFKCGCCGKNFTCKTYLQRHMLIHCGERAFKCYCCEKKFTHKSYLKQHMLIHRGEKTFKCDCCKKIFTHKSHLQRHMLIHSGEKPFKCDCCEKTFNNKSNLLRHVFIHSGEKPFKCDLCEKTFNHKGNFQQHMLIHSGEKPFKCDCCKKTFSEKGTLRKHMLTHSGEKPFKCDCCEKKYTQVQSLKRHSITHTGERSV